MKRLPPAISTIAPARIVGALIPAHRSRRRRAPSLVLLALAVAVLAQPAGAAEPDRGALRAQPHALDAAGPLRAQQRTAASAALAGAPRGFPAVHLSPGTIAGYIPLDLFGGTLVTPLGDEDLVTFNVPSFKYNGSTFDAVTVDSNGYVIPGSDTSNENNNCCDIVLGSARPNGILAPFWTDLDGTGAPGVLINVLTDGVGVWTVVEWRVNDFGTGTLRTFQLWLGAGGVQDIAYSYDFATFASAPTGQDFTVAAENLDGSLFDSLGLHVMPTQDLIVTSDESTPNQVPVATGDSYSTAEDTDLTVPAPGVLANDSDGEGDPLTAELVDGPTHGAVTLNADGSFTYVPAADFNGTDTFTYRADDGYDASPDATVTLTVTAVDDAPTIAVTAGTACGADDRSGTVALRLADIDNAPASLTLSRQSSNPALVPVANVAFSGSGAQRSATVTAVSGRTGSATVTVGISDGVRQSSVTIAVQAGGNGIDTLTGSAESDILLGQSGPDTLSGLGGADVLCGGRGDDAMTGGAGADHFGGGQGVDRATDLTPGDGDTAAAVP